jgi:hypothetical protein
MKHIIVLILFGVLFSCSSVNRSKVSEEDKVPDYALEMKKMYSIETPANWYEHYFHGILSYSPIEFKGTENCELNYLWINISEPKKDISLVDYVKLKNNHQQWKRVKVKNTDNGMCYVERRTSKSQGEQFTSLKNTYKYNGKFYELIYRAEDKVFYKYIEESSNMMNSFKIIQK